MVSPNILNQRGRETILAETDQMRQAIISFAHDSVKHYLGIDKKNIGEHSEGGDGYEFFVLVEALNLHDREQGLALAVRLEAAVDIEHKTGSTERRSLTILHPLAKDVDINDEDFDTNELPVPEMIYFVFENDGALSHFAVGADMSFFYIPSDTTALGIDEIDAMEEISAGIEGKLVQSGLPFLASLHEDLINMHAVATRRDVFGPTEVPTDEA